MRGGGVVGIAKAAANQPRGGASGLMLIPLPPDVTVHRQEVGVTADWGRAFFLFVQRVKQLFYLSGRCNTRISVSGKSSIWKTSAVDWRGPMVRCCKVKREKRQHDGG